MVCNALRGLGGRRQGVGREGAGRNGSIYSGVPRLEHRRMWSGHRGGDGGGHGGVVGRGARVKE
jgi:hypothetical protein